MKLNYINHDKTKLIIFFAGFYTDFNCFLEFDNNESDILFIYDYSSLDTDELEYFDFTPYTEINLLAYSYGVWASNYCFTKRVLPSLSKSTAVSGTFYPIDDTLGIPLKIYDLMLNSLSKDTIENFERKMQIGSKGSINKAERTIENLKEELKNIKELSLKEQLPDYTKGGLSFDNVIMTSMDRIIPFRAQEAFWQNHTHKIILKSGHFPFFEFESLNELLDV